MSCPKDTNLTVRDEFGNLIAPIVKRISNCNGRKSVYPSFTPVINSISVNSSISGVYTVVYISGSNFLPPSNGDTYVNFGSYTHLPIIFYSSFNISFIVPLNVSIGFYNIRVVNVYNDNFSLPVSQSYSGIPNYSNSLTYTVNTLSNLLNKLYALSGSFKLTSTYNYRHIITFTGTGNLKFLKFYNKIINFAVIYNGKSVVSGFFSKSMNSLIINKNETDFPSALYNYPGDLVFKSNEESSSSLSAIFYFNN
jgi:hypothetical protein